MRECFAEVVASAIIETVESSQYADPFEQRQVAVQTRRHQLDGRFEELRDGDRPSSGRYRVDDSPSTGRAAQTLEAEQLRELIMQLI